MSIFYNNLYSNVLKENCNMFNKLTIISGYASASFLQRVLVEFPNLYIDLYIGMSQEGILISNHNKFLEIMRTYPNVKVYYQVNGNLTHIKSYTFSANEKIKTFIGSANFIENGFICNNEILSEINEPMIQLHDKQKEVSKLCTDKDIGSYIKFSDNKLQNEDIFNEIDLIKSKIEYFNKENNIYNEVDSKFLSNYIKLPVVVPLKASALWDSTGINSIFKDKQPNLVMANYNSSKLKEFFNESMTNYVYDFENTLLKCELDGPFKRELHFLNINIYDYFRKIIGLKEQTPITHEHLEYFGYKFFTFKKVESNKYLLTFTN